MDEQNKIKKQLETDFELLKQYKAFYEKTTGMPHLGLDSAIHDHFKLKKELEDGDKT